MKLGPTQTAWVESLEKHPERQERKFLGRKNEDGSYTACCLGEGCIIINGDAAWEDGVICSGGRLHQLSGRDYQKLGLFSSHGSIFGGFDGHISLAHANDNGKTWPEIAAFIRANPEKVFTKSV